MCLTLLWMLHVCAGLFSSWNETVRSFHRQFGGKLFEEEYLPGRVKLGFKEVKRHVATLLRDEDYHDPWDEQVYQFAEKLFREKNRQA